MYIYKRCTYNIKIHKSFFHINSIINVKILLRPMESDLKVDKRNSNFLTETDANYRDLDRQISQTIWQHVSFLFLKILNKDFEMKYKIILYCVSTIVLFDVILMLQ